MFPPLLAIWTFELTVPCAISSWRRSSDGGTGATGLAMTRTRMLTGLSLIYPTAIVSPRSNPVKRTVSLLTSAAAISGQG